MIPLAAVLVLAACMLGMSARALFFALGFFAISAQTALFRDFLSVFEGSELSVGVFFGSWFTWIALGAFAARRLTIPLPRIPFFVLLYIPAYLIERELILHARTLAAVAPYEVFPLPSLFAGAFLANAPVSAATGVLFTLACRRNAGDRVAAPTEHALAQGTAGVSDVYAGEAVGAAAGGLAATLYAATEYPSLALFLLAGWALLFASSLNARGRALFIIALAAAPAVVFASFSNRWMDRTVRELWARSFPGEHYEGHFATHRAEYAYGGHEDRFFLLSGGSIVESVPNTAQASETAAVLLAQCPQAGRVLVVGPDSVSLCLQLLRLPLITEVTLLAPDPACLQRLRPHLASLFGESINRIRIPDTDARHFLDEQAQGFDLIALNLPGPRTLAMNRYHTREFAACVKEALAPGGVAAMRITGGENAITEEAAIIGASAITTFSSAFAHTAMKPGETTWLFGADSDVLSQDTAVLQQRFGAIPGAPAMFPTEAVASLYPTDRVTFQMDLYNRARAEYGQDFLENTDRSPRALLFALLLMGRQAGLDLTVPAAAWVEFGLFFLMAGIVLFGVIRAVVIVRRGLVWESWPAFFDIGVLTVLAGFAGMAASLIVMYQYQTENGTLYFAVGLLASLFMAGAWLGSTGATRFIALFAANQGLTQLIFVAFLEFNLVLFFLLALMPFSMALFFAPIYMIFAGMITGALFPAVTHVLLIRGWTPQRAAAALESLDHAGAALGALTTGLLLLPFFGMQNTAVLGELMMLACVFPIIRMPALQVENNPLERLRRPLGYALLGCAAWLLIGSNLAATAMPDQSERDFARTARELLNDLGLPVEEAHANEAVAGVIDVLDKSGPAPEMVLVRNTADLAPRSSGFSGPLSIAFAVTENGVLKGLRILPNRETPAYLDLVEPWTKTLAGMNLYDPGAIANVDGVSGATITSRAVLRALQESGIALAAASGHETGSMPAENHWLPDRAVLLFSAFLAGAVLLRLRPNRRLRRVFLLLSCVVLGGWLNVQYSTHQVFALLSGIWPAAGFGLAPLLVFGVPLLTVLVGNVYCGYVCPFGALQETIGEIVPAPLKHTPGSDLWRILRSMKYVLLALLALRFAFGRDFGFLEADPLTTFFSAHGRTAVLAFAGAVLLLSLPFRRFWCRNLCPAGAFLSLLNRFRLIRRLSPPARPRFCDMGVQRAEELDCLRCDRCLHE